MKFLTKLNDALRKAQRSDLETMNTLFEKSRIWQMGPEFLKVLLHVQQQGNGTYTMQDISSAIAIEDKNGEPWPGPVMIESILANLESAGLIRVFWAEGKGLRANYSFKVDCERLYHEWGIADGDFWNNLAEAIQSASYRDLKALERLYKETPLLKQPAFFLRVLTWAATNGSGPVSRDAVKEEFSNILKHIRSEHDSRDAESGLRWFHEKGLLGVAWGAPGEPIQLDVEPLKKWGFEAEVQA
jgi:hypothetical protein